MGGDSSVYTGSAYMSIKTGKSVVEFKWAPLSTDLCTAEEQVVSC